jgi:hypothetical protein
MEADAFRYDRRLMGGRWMRLVATAIAVVFSLVAAGCGKSSAEKKREFLAKANRICKNFEDQQNQVIVPSVNPLAANVTHRQRAQWGVGIKNLAVLGTQEVKALGTLKPPKDIADEFQALLTTKGGAFASLLQGADAAKRNHVSEISAPIKASRDALAQATKQARGLGLKECE